MESIKMILALTVMLSGCATVSTIDRRKESIYNCTLTLIDREITALDSERVCSNIYKKQTKPSVEEGLHEQS